MPRSGSSDVNRLGSKVSEGSEFGSGLPSVPEGSGVKKENEWMNAEVRDGDPATLAALQVAGLRGSRAELEESVAVELLRARVEFERARCL